MENNNNNNSNKNKESRSSSLTSSSTSVRNWEEVLQLPEEGRISSFLRILLVEADDPTRRLIAAHLRKSTYTVAAVSDGLEAWETLTKSPHDIDLILMETELPSISGYALLTLIMEHDYCKNIPVIMMSSCDSINLVLNCMLKGAADFLVKPVRRNELRNLWQHVWRKQTQTAVHVPQDTEDAHLNNENKGEKVTDIRMNRGGPSDLSNPGSGEECELVIPKSEFRDKSFTSGLEVSCIEAFNSAASILGEGVDCAETMIKDEGEWSHSHSEDRNADELVEPSSAIDLIGKFENRPRDVNGDFDTFHDDEKFSFSPYLELSLEKFYPSCLRVMKVDEQHMLNYSYASAFSRYNNSMALKPLSSAVGNSFAESKEDSNICSYLDDRLVEKSFGASTQFGPVSNYGQEIMVGHSELAVEKCPGPQFGCIPSTESPFGSSGTGYDHSLPPVTYTQSGFLWSEIHNSEQGCGATINDSAERTMQEESNSGSAERLRHDSTVPAVDGNRSLYNSTAINRVCETICITVDGDATMVGESAKTSASESLKESHLLIGRVRMDSKCSAQREAALLKFRQKRKERCYDKTVRYQSRKRLAEQRPRVKGQFVRQMQTGPSADTDC